MGLVEGLAVWVGVSVLFSSVVGKVLEAADRRNESRNQARLRAAGY